MGAYTSEKNVQMLIFLLKEHGIKRVIVSPGTTNITFVASIQKDSFFELYSVADERSAAYMACGLAAESGEPVVISCTGATASRNYVPGLTEAYYRKLPVLAVTSTQHMGRIGQLAPQVIDRTVIQNDIAVMHVDIPSVYTDEDLWDCNVKLNTALLALTHRGGGPVHINLTTTYSRDFSVEKLPQYRVIRRVYSDDIFPEIATDKVAIFVGAHLKWSEELTNSVDEFCENYNAVVLCDHTSNYHGKYRVQYNLLSVQSRHKFEASSVDLLIDMGEMSGSYMGLRPKNVWRVSSDGVARDTFKVMSYIFDMSENHFFSTLNKNADNERDTSFYELCKSQYDSTASAIPELPFSNIWIASVASKMLPENTVLHLGILNSLRSWNFFEIPSSIDCYCNTGGFGIDGIVSSAIGGALAVKEKTHFLVLGDLAFFYDLNASANRHLCNNLRILLVNNGCGTEFKNYSHFASMFGEDADDYIAAAGHYGNKSLDLVRHYAQDLGFIYLSADSKETFTENISKFTSEDTYDSPVLFEVFTDPTDESNALKAMASIVVDPENKIKSLARDVLGEKGVKTIKKIIKR